MTKEEYINVQYNQPASEDLDVLKMLFDWSGIKTLRGLDVLEVGCGNGTFMNYLKDLHLKSYAGIDINPVFVRDDIIEGYQEDLSSIKDKSIDLYISSETLEHSYDHTKAISEMYRVLRKGGMALIGLPWGEQHSDAPIHMSAKPLGLTEDTTDYIKKQFKSKRVESIRDEVVNNSRFIELRLLIKLK